VPRSMVPPAPDVDLYKPRKRKRNQKPSEDKEEDEEEPKLKVVKKEDGTTSESIKEKVVAEKAEVIVAEKSDAV
ncbi:hypothetical protein A2U01_0104329, partial [Trifolium medium]|nr:hypothetical protein [Trifolium medium]